MTERTPLVLIGGVKKQLPVGDTLAKSIVGLDRADNTPDLEKPVSQPAQDALAKKADLDSGGKVPIAQIPVLSTSNVSEGSNLYFTDARVRSVTLNGVVFTLNSAVVASDSLLAAIGKIQTQINNRLLTTGTAAAATKLATARTINGVNFDGTANITIADSTKVPSSSVGVANGVAGLDANGMVPAAQLPSYVDDVLEYNTFSNLPSTGETGKIYVTLDPYTDGQGRTSSQFRWTGSAYTPIIASPGTTDAVTEGTTNLYFTTNRVRQILLTGLSVAVGGVIAATDSLMDALGKLQNQISNLNKGSVGLGQVDNTSDLSKPVSNPTAAALVDTGGQNLAYNSAFLKISSADSRLADGWEFDGPGSPGNSTGSASIVASFITPVENAQRLTVTNLNTSSYYRSLVNSLARIFKVNAGQTVTATIRAKGTAGLQLRIFIQAVDSKPTAIAAPASGFILLTGDPQAISFTYANLPANTAGVRVFYRLYAGPSVTDGTVDLARPKLEIGSYPTGWSEDTVSIREDVASKAPVANPIFTGDVLRINTPSTMIGSGISGNSGIELGSWQGASTPFIDFHSGATPVDYDCRLLASGGNGSSGNGSLSFNGVNFNFNSDVTVQRGAQSSALLIRANAGQNRFVRFMSDTAVRWDIGAGNVAESGGNTGSDFFINAYADNSSFINSPWGINRATGETRMTRAAVSGPFKVGQFTLATLPSASAYEGYDIDVTDAAGGPKRCRSNRTNWLILNTTTPVS